MIRLLGLWLVGCALCVTPVAAEEDQYDGPTAVRPLTPKPQHFAPPNTVCDFEPVLPGEERTPGPSSFSCASRGRQARRSPTPSPR